MGLRSKKELLHKYFLFSQFFLLLGGGVVSIHMKFHKKTVENPSAKDEVPNYSIFEAIQRYLVKKID